MLAIKVMPNALNNFVCKYKSFRNKRSKRIMATTATAKRNSSESQEETKPINTNVNKKKLQKPISNLFITIWPSPKPYPRQWPQILPA